MRPENGKFSISKHFFFSSANSSNSTFLAASNRTDRTLDDRVKSAQDASKIHKLLYGQALRITREDVEQGRFYPPDLGENSEERKRHEERQAELTRIEAELNAQMAAMDAARRNRSPNPQAESSGGNYVAPQGLAYYSIPGLPQTSTGQGPEAQVTSSNLTTFPRQTPFAPAYTQGQQQFSMPQTTVGYTIGDALAYTSAQVPNQMQQNLFTSQMTANYPMMGISGYSTAQFPTQPLPVPQSTVEYTMGDACEYNIPQFPTQMQQEPSASQMAADNTMGDAPEHTAAQAPNQMQQDISAPQMPEYTMPDAPGLSAAQVPNQVVQDVSALQIPAGLTMNNLTFEEMMAQIQNQVEEIPGDQMATMSLPQSFTVQAQNNVEGLPEPQPTAGNTNMDLPEISTAQDQNAVAETPEPQWNPAPMAQAQSTTPEEEQPPAPFNPPVTALPDADEEKLLSDEDFAALLAASRDEDYAPPGTGLRYTIDPTLPVIEENRASGSGQPVGGRLDAPQYPQGVNPMVWADGTIDPSLFATDCFA